MNRIIFSLIAAAGLSPGLANAADTELWRLDCGAVEVRDLNAFSDSYAYTGQKRTLAASCYLIRHDNAYLLWDTGLPAALIGQPTDPSALLAPSLKTDLVSQLKQINVEPAQIGLVGASHGHFDHVGQASSFPNATLMIGQGDLDAYKQSPLPFAFDPAPLKTWLDGTSKVDPVVGDKDVFGDGSVVILSTPGHTHGETALLVRLNETGPVLLSGDVVHFEEQFANNGVPPFNVDRSESLASMARIEEIAKNLGGKIVVQHDANDIAKLPAFPASAK